MDQVSTEKKKIYKNVFLVSIAFLLLFVAFESMSNLQSSINAVDNLGLWSSVVVYATLILSCVLLPSLFISKLTVKWTMVVCTFCYSSYIAAQFYPEFYTLLPTAAVVGLGAAPLWSAKCSYLTISANRLACFSILNDSVHRLAQLEGTPPDTVVAKFFGIFFFFYQCNSIIGHIISTAVLSSGVQDNSTVSKEEMLTCGAAFCPNFGENIGNMSQTDDAVDDDVVNENFKTDLTKIYIMAGVYLACSLTAGFLLASLLDPLGEKESSRGELPGLKLLTATLRHLRKRKQLLLVPLTLWSGIEQGFFGADFTAVGDFHTLFMFNSCCRVLSRAPMESTLLAGC